MKNENTKTKRTSFRMDADEYERLTSDAALCGMGFSEYIRSRVTGNIDRVFYDPSMTAEMRAYRETIRTLVQEVEHVRRGINVEDGICMEEIGKIRALVKSIYHEMESVEQKLDGYKKELMERGNHQAA